MGELGLNKIMAALLATGLFILGLSTLSSAVFGAGGDGGHHGHEEDKPLNEIFAEKYAYFIEVEETAVETGEPEEVFDLGLALANAEISSGERVFAQQCAQCHSIEQGGANGQGPNLYDIVGAPKAQKAGFNYSNALSGSDGPWDYEALNAWLEAPARYARGTTMSFAGLRRDSARADVIAYLAEYTPDAPAFPEPANAPAEEPEPAAETEPAEAPDAEVEAVPETPADDEAAAAEDAAEEPAEAENEPT